MKIVPLSMAASSLQFPHRHQWRARRLIRARRPVFRCFCGRILVVLIWVLRDLPSLLSEMSSSLADCRPCLADSLRWKAPSISVAISDIDISELTGCLAGGPTTTLSGQITSATRRREGKFRGIYGRSRVASDGLVGPPDLENTLCVDYAWLPKQ